MAPSKALLHALRPKALQPLTLFRLSRTVLTRYTGSIRPSDGPVSGYFVRKTLNIRPFTTKTLFEKLRNSVNIVRKTHPILFPVMLLASFGSLSLLALMAYDELAHPSSPNLSAYPLPVEQQLRVALHYTHVRPDPDMAADAYQRALEVADQCGLYAFSREILGVRVKLAECLERFGRVKASIEVLWGVVSDCEERVRDLDRAESRNQRTKPTDNSLNADGAITREPTLRQFLLREQIKCLAKIADLSSSEYIQNPIATRDTLSSAMQILVSETPDAQRSGFSVENGAGLDLDEIAAILVQAGDAHLATNQAATASQIYHLALPTLRRAQDGKPSCKEAHLLASMSAAMGIALQDPRAKINGKPVTKDTLQRARQAALAFASEVPHVVEGVGEGQRDVRCVLSFFSAALNIAGIQVDMGELDRAREGFEGVRERAREIGLGELVKAADGGLRKIDESNRERTKSKTKGGWI